MIYGMTVEQLQAVMRILHAKMQMHNHNTLPPLTSDEYAAVMAALEIAGEL